MKRLLNLFFCLSAVMMLSAPQFAAAQTAEVTVSGKVSDQNGLPIIGAGVVLSSDSSKGTTTDLDGNYTITVPANSTLNFSCIGYGDEAVSVNGRSRIDVVLSEDNEFIEETIVIGYGVQRKSDITGSVASVRSSELSNRSTSDAAAALQGKAAGVQIVNSSGAPGEAAKIRVRGYSSNSGNIGPLLIVDGLKVDNIQYLDPSMIQNIEILKDAASAAIYGAEAGNGVVLITTKSGASENGRSSITYSYKLTRQDLGKKAELFDAASWIAYKEASGFDMEATLKQNNYDGTDTDWFDVVFGPSWSQQHSMTFQGGNDKGHFFTSINYVDNDGIVRGDKDVYKRLSAQINADYKLYDWITVGTNTSIERYTRKSVSQQGRYGNLLNAVMTLDPLTPVYYSDPSQFATSMKAAYDEGKNILKDPTNGLYYATSKYIDDDNGNPLLQRDKTDSSSQGINVRGTLFANLTPIKGLVFTSRFGYRIGRYVVYRELFRQRKRKRERTGHPPRLREELPVSQLCEQPLHYDQDLLQLAFAVGKHRLLRPYNLQLRRPIQFPGELPRRRVRLVQAVAREPLGLLPLVLRRLDRQQREVLQGQPRQRHILVPQAARLMGPQR